MNFFKMAKEALVYQLIVKLLEVHNVLFLMQKVGRDNINYKLQVVHNNALWYFDAESCVQQYITQI